MKPVRRGIGKLTLALTLAVATLLLPSSAAHAWQGHGGHAGRGGSGHSGHHGHHPHSGGFGWTWGGYYYPAWGYDSFYGGYAGYGTYNGAAATSPYFGIFDGSAATSPYFGVYTPSWGVSPGFPSGTDQSLNFIGSLW